MIFWLRFISISFLISITTPTLAAEIIYAKTQRFMPITSSRVASTSQHEFISQPAKFFPLTQARHPTAVYHTIKSDIRNNSIVVSEGIKKSILDLKPAKAATVNKTKMSPEQAQQIIAIFSAN